MIFISGIHGVGKSFFTKKVKDNLNISTYTASKLIAEYDNCNFESSKKVEKISHNQNVLIDAIKNKMISNDNFLLDGHFCLLDKNNKINRIELNTYIDLQPKAIILLTEQVEIIAERRKVRDGITENLEFLSAFQAEEEQYAVEVANKLEIPIYISSGSDDIEKAVDFIIQNL